MPPRNDFHARLASALGIVWRGESFDDLTDRVRDLRNELRQIRLIEDIGRIERAESGLRDDIEGHR